MKGRWTGSRRARGPISEVTRLNVSGIFAGPTKSLGGPDLEKVRVVKRNLRTFAEVLRSDPETALAEGNGGWNLS